MRSFDFGEATLVTSTCKSCVNESVDDFAGLIGSDLLAAKAKHVRVIMLAGQGSGFLITNERGANARNFVRRDTHADAGGANQNAKIGLMLGHCMGNRQRMIRIVAGFFGMPTEVADRMPLFLKVKLDRFLQLEATMVRSQRDLRL